MPTTTARALRARATAPAFNQQVLDRLMEVHELFAARKSGGKRAMISYLQAPGLNLSGRNLTEADFTGANFERARMIVTNFERASLYCADLREVDARNANFTRADIRGVSLRGANLAGANLDDADMRQAVLAKTDSPAGFGLSAASAKQDQTGPTLYSVDFSNCSMKGARLNNARLKGANFSGAMLDSVDFKGADLTGALFEGAVLTGVTLEDLRIDRGALESCVVDPTAAALGRAALLRQQVVNADRWVATGGAEGRPAVLNGEDLRPLAGAFAGKRLTAMSAVGACAIGVDFGGAQLQGANFDGADLRDADFRDADLRGASFKGARLWHAHFDRADVRALLLKSGERAVNLDGAVYAEACFRHSRSS
jgi:uncharacterized protein YjbI with pentapeptide repeats